jgi:hypothetical protein
MLVDILQFWLRNTGDLYNAKLNLLQAASVSTDIGRDLQVKICQ